MFMGILKDIKSVTIHLSNPKIYGFYYFLHNKPKHPTLKDVEVHLNGISRVTNHLSNPLKYEFDIDNFFY